MIYQDFKRKIKIKIGFIFFTQNKFFYELCEIHLKMTVTSLHYILQYNHLPLIRTNHVWLKQGKRPLLYVIFVGMMSSISNANYPNGLLDEFTAHSHMLCFSVAVLMTYDVIFTPSLPYSFLFFPS